MWEKFKKFTMHSKAMIGYLLMLLVLLIFSTSAHATLFRVGPIDPSNGFPRWYQDTKGLALDLALPRNQAQLDSGATLITNPPFTLPFVFPTNFPDEAFWWNATTTIDLTPGNNAVLVLAIEAAFGGGVPLAGDQISFGRIRIIIDAPVDGTYTITYPYGVKVFPDVTAGKRAIAFTDDIGIGAPGDFTGALQSGVGPFLVAADAQGNPLPYVTVPGDNSGDKFLSDAVTPVLVTGSPLDTNFFQVSVDTAGGFDGDVNTNDNSLQVNEFTLMGKVHQGAIGSPLAVDRATYARSGSGAHVDVFATTSPGPGAATPVLSLGDAEGTNLMPSLLMKGPTNLGQYYGQSIPTDAGAIPAAVIVTNVADNPPSSVKLSVVDEVTITNASYNPGTGAVTITATSSDKIVLQQLIAIGLPGSVSGSEPLTSTNSNDPSEQQIIFPIGEVPPFCVTVISSAGGQDTQTVTTTAGGAFDPGGPIAVDDSVSIEAGSALSVDIDILPNDFGYSPTTVEIVSQGTHGTAFANATGVVTYTFNNSTFVGDDFFTYTVRNAAGLKSNVASVLVTTTAPAAGPVPIAVNDGPFSAQVNVPLVIPATTLTNNDDGNGGTIDPNTIQIVSVAPASATAVFAGGNVTFTGIQAGSASFTYTVANTNGQRSGPAIVSITVLPATDVITNLTARFRTKNRRWDVTGNCSVPGLGNTVTITLVHNGVDAGVVGTTPVDAVGVWSLRVQSSAVIAAPGDQVRADSTAGGSAIAPVNVTN